VLYFMCSRDPHLCDKLRFLEFLCFIYKILLKKKQNIVIIHVYSSIYTDSSSVFYSCLWWLGWFSINTSEESFISSDNFSPQSIFSFSSTSLRLSKLPIGIGYRLSNMYANKKLGFRELVLALKVVPDTSFRYMTQKIG